MIVLVTPSKALLPIAVVSLALLSGCSSGASDAVAPSTAKASASAPTVAPSPQVAPSPSAAADPVPANVRAAVVDAISSGNASALEPYLAPTVHNSYVTTGYFGDIPASMHALIIQDMKAYTSNGATWNFNLPAATISGYAAKKPDYAADFTSNAIVGVSSDHIVLSFTVENGLIVRVLSATPESGLG
jgi:hypothetical protein